MYNIVKRSWSFDTADKKDTREYEAILNDPLCSITTNETAILKEISYDPDTGKPMMQIEKIMRTIEWDVKVPL